LFRSYGTIQVPGPNFDGEPEDEEYQPVNRVEIRVEVEIPVLQSLTCPLRHYEGDIALGKWDVKY
jgi:hypothetical protein